MQISNDWQIVLDNYLKLTESWKRELFLKSMSKSQKDYLLLIAQEATLHQPQTVPTVTQGAVLHAGIQPDKNQNLGTSFNQNLMLSKDAHLLSHKAYKTSKRKWWATLLPVILIVTALTSLTGVVFFAWVGGGLTNLAFLNSIIGNKAKADEFSYSQWINQFTDIKDKSESADPDGDGLSNLDEFKLGTNPTKSDENNNNTVDGLDYINKDATLIKSYKEDGKIWLVLENQTIFLRLQKATLNKLGLDNSGQSLLKLNKIVIPKINQLEVFALPEASDAILSTDTLKKQAVLVHYLGTNWAGENLSVWFSNQSKIEEMLPGDTLEAYLEDETGNNWYQRYELKAANTFSADSEDIFTNETNRPNLKIVLCQPENGCKKALVLTFEIKETKQISFDNSSDSSKI